MTRGNDRPRTDGRHDGREARKRGFRLFAYGLLRSDVGSKQGRELLTGCLCEGPATVTGTLYDLGEHPALILAGSDTVRGELWRCPPHVLERIDRFEGVADGLFRRVGVEVGDAGCWCYVAGPRIAQHLRPSRRIPSGRWSPGAAGRVT